MQNKGATNLRVNVYAEEMTDRVEIISKEIEGQVFTGVRFYLELPCTIVDSKTVVENGINKTSKFKRNVSGPFIHRPGDDDSAAVTFWGKTKLKEVLQKALAQLEKNDSLPQK